MAVSAVRTSHPAFAQASIFQGLPLADVEEIAACFRPRRFVRDEPLFLEGAPADVYYLLAEGQVKIVQTSPAGDEVILHLMGSGELAGALPNLDQGTYPASATALGAVLAYAIAPGEFEAILQRHPQVAIRLLHLAAERLRAAHERLREQATERVERRIARTLTRLARQVGQRTDAGVLLGVSLTRQDLAEMCGTSLFTVSRTLKEWERRGLLKAGRERIVLIDTHGLVSLADDLPGG